MTVTRTWSVAPVTMFPGGLLCVVLRRHAGSTVAWLDSAQFAIGVDSHRKPMCMGLGNSPVRGFRHERMRPFTANSIQQRFHMKPSP